MSEDDLDLGGIENNVEKEENVRYQHFLIFSQYFQRAPSTELLKHGIVWERVKSLTHSPDF